METKDAAIRTRILIQGELTSASALAIRDGRVIPQAFGDNDVLIPSVVATTDGRCVIPGSAIKGQLRRELQALSESGSGFSPTQFRDLLGTTEEHDDFVNDEAVLVKRKTGKLIVHPAISSAGAALNLKNETRVSIDRTSGTARDGQLFTYQIVPTQTRFECNFLIESHDWKIDLTALLAALEGFNARKLRVGSSTMSGFGLLDWHTVQVNVFGHEQLTEWLKAGACNSWKVSARQLTASELNEFLHNAKKLNEQVRKETKSLLNLEINFSSLFLTACPEYMLRREQEKNSKLVNSVSVSEWVGKQAKYVIKGSSFRGVMRSQAEKILRTLGHSCEARGLSTNQTINKNCTCMVCEMFGGTNSKSRLGFENLYSAKSKTEQETLKHDMVAIDRFTGAARDGAKFQWEALLKPSFLGALHIDQLSPWMMGLLAYVLRDLSHGDACLGAGTTKGYGQFGLKFDTSLFTAEHLSAFHSEVAQRQK